VISEKDNLHEIEEPFRVYQQILRERLHLLLRTLHPTLRADVVQALEEKGKLLSRDQSGSAIAGQWALITLLVAQCVSPEINSFVAGNVAIAVECFICALDLLDDVEDEDQTPIVLTLGSARVLNISTTLLALAQRAILSLSEFEVSPSLILRLLGTLQDVTLIAATGQHQDILTERSSVQDITFEECIAIATQKAGALLRLACCLGALCAEADDELCELFSTMGEQLGIAAQLDNDSRDLYYLLHMRKETSVQANQPIIRSFKTDLVRSKKTLPVILAARSDSTLQSLSLLNDEDNQQTYLVALHEGITASLGICLLYLERARDYLRKIEAQQSVSPTLHLLLRLS
jgi:geranylgeranyl pyrophosphate synthase